MAVAVGVHVLDGGKVVAVVDKILAVGVAGRPVNLIGIVAQVADVEPGTNDIRVLDPGGGRIIGRLDAWPGSPT